MDKLVIASFFKKDKVVLIYKAIFIIIFMFGLAMLKLDNVYGNFHTSLAFSLLIQGVNAHFLAVTYFVINICVNFSGNGLIFTLLVMIGIIVYELAKGHKLFKSNHILIWLIFSMINIGYVLIHFSLEYSLFYVILTSILSIIYFYITNIFFTAVKNRGFYKKINLDEKLCGAMVLVSFFIGFSQLQLCIDLSQTFAIFLILLITYVFEAGFCITFGVLLGIAFSVTYINPVYISLYVVLSVVALAFKTNYKVLSVLGVVIAHTLFSTYFIDYYAFNIYTFISILVVGIIFQFIPLVVFESILDVFAKRDNKVILIDVVNRTKNTISNRLKDISLVFSKMDSVFRKMVRGNLKDDVAIAMVKDDVYNHMCSGCENKKECVYISSEICDDALSDIVKTAFSKGKISVLDIPQRVGSICNVAKLTSIVNKVMQDFKNYYDLMKNMDSSKLLIASQLNGVSNLLEQLSKEISTNISFNKEKERYILEELSYYNIIVHECLVYEEDINTLVVNLIVNAGFDNKKLLEKVVSKCCNSRLHIVSIDATENSKATLLTLKTKPPLDLVYGSASVNKGGHFVSGDHYTVIKIDDSRYMVALCDGMGSGKKASSISTLTISLIENYYKAGFSDDVIMGSINKLLMLSEIETYSTVDLCVFDLKKNNYSFIKLGASVSFIKGSMDTAEIEGSGLPIGILEDIKPHIILKKINAFDTVILCSDGVVDSFSKTSLKNYINSLDIINPNILAKTILHKAISNYGGIYKDDMTVVAVRVFPT